MSKMKEQFEKEFPICTEVGLYPYRYILDDLILCPMCARDLFLDKGAKAGKNIYWEGPILNCDNCQDEIESAYGDPEEEK